MFRKRRIAAVSVTLALSASLFAAGPAIAATGQRGVPGASPAQGLANCKVIESQYRQGAIKIIKPCFFTNTVTTSGVTRYWYSFLYEYN